MIYKFTCIVILMNLMYEFIELIFPSKKMKGIVKSFVMICIIYAICDLFFKMI